MRTWAYCVVRAQAYSANATHPSLRQISVRYRSSSFRRRARKRAFRRPREPRDERPAQSIHADRGTREYRHQQAAHRSAAQQWHRMRPPILRSVPALSTRSSRPGCLAPKLMVTCERATARQGGMNNKKAHTKGNYRRPPEPRRAVTQERQTVPARLLIKDRVREHC
jgi:hypothetical protein